MSACSRLLVVAGELVGRTKPAMAQGSSLSRYARRLTTRVSNSVERFSQLLGESGAFWTWILLSGLGFFTVTSVASVADVRLWQMRSLGAARVSRYLGLGMRTFWRLLLDRRTPLLARASFVLGLAYWLVPWDIIRDDQLIPGLGDDLVIAVIATKLFLRFCPDDLVGQVAGRVSRRNAR